MPSTNNWTVEVLTDDYFLVSGTDIKGRTGETTLFAPAWAAVLEAEKDKVAEGLFSKAVRKDMKATLKAIRQIKETFGKVDPLSVYVVKPGVKGEPAEEFPLDSVEAKILFAIASGETGRLRWVGIAEPVLVLTKA